MADKVLKLSDDIHKKLRIEALNQGVTFTNLANGILDNFFLKRQTVTIVSPTPTMAKTTRANGDSFIVRSQLITGLGLMPAVIIGVMEHESIDGKFDLSIQTLAYKVGCSKRTALNHLSALKEIELITPGKKTERNTISYSLNLAEENQTLAVLKARGQGGYNAVVFKNEKQTKEEAPSIAETEIEF